MVSICNQTKLRNKCFRFVLRIKCQNGGKEIIIAAAETAAAAAALHISEKIEGRERFLRYKMYRLYRIYDSTYR